MPTTAAAKPRPTIRKPSDHSVKRQQLAMTWLNLSETERYSAMPEAKRNRLLADFKKQLKQSLAGTTFDEWLATHHR